jgi:hypothetical protein
MVLYKGVWIGLQLVITVVSRSSFIMMYAKGVSWCGVPHWHAFFHALTQGPIWAS